MFGIYKNYNLKIAMTCALFMFFLFIFFETTSINNFLFMPIIFIFSFLLFYFTSSIIIDIGSYYILKMNNKKVEKKIE